MATAAESLAGLPQAEASQELARSWKKLTRAATIVAVLTSPALYIWFTQRSDLSWWQALLATVAIVVVFRGFSRPPLPQADPGPEPVRHREPRPARRGHRRPPPGMVLALLVQDRRLLRRPDHDHLAVPRGHLVRDDRLYPRRDRDDLLLTCALDPGRLRLLPLHRELRDPLRPAPRDEPHADQDVRARRRAMGREARRRARPGGGQGGGPPGRVDLAIGRAVRAPRRQTRARRALLRPPRHRQDDAREGARDRLQLAVRLDPGLRLRGDVHRHRRDRRPLPRLEGEARGPQVGRDLHRVHRRDRRRRHAPPGARQRLRRRDQRATA